MKTAIFNIFKSNLHVFEDGKFVFIFVGEVDIFLET
jgi:hypothetical protein